MIIKLTVNSCTSLCLSCWPPSLSLWEQMPAVFFNDMVSLLLRCAGREVRQCSVQQLSVFLVFCLSVPSLLCSVSNPLPFLCPPAFCCFYLPFSLSAMCRLGFLPDISAQKSKVIITIIINNSKYEIH